MGEDDPYKRMGVDPKAAAQGLKKKRDKSNPELKKDSVLECVECGKIKARSEMEDEKYCIICAKKKSKYTKKPSNNKYTKPSNRKPKFNFRKEFEIIEECKQNNSEKSVYILIDKLKSDNNTIRYKAARYLGQKKDPAAITPLLDAMKDEDHIVRNNSVWALGEIGDLKALQPLKQVLNDDRYIKKSVSEALKKIQM